VKAGLKIVLNGCRDRIVLKSQEHFDFFENKDRIERGTKEKGKSLDDKKDMKGKT
jgi:hypothetical protein